nr:carbohydrate-binding domain-containing protein [Lachnospiraceae bacterium]
MRKRKNARFLALMTAVTMVFGQLSFALPVLAEGETAGEEIASEEIRDDAIAADAAITLGAATAVVDASGNNAVKVDTETTAGAAEVKITEAGNYRITGEGSNVYVSVAKSLAEGVTLILDDLTIDDSGLNGKLGADTSVISCAKGTPLTIVLRGTSVITGSSSYTTEPEAVISVKKDGKLDITGTSGSLTIKDGMSADAAAAAKSAGLDPADGIKMGNDSVGGVFTLASGTVNIDVNGDGIKAKNGRIFIDGGSANVTSGGDGISAKRDFDCEEGYGSVILSDGAVTINSKDDGIQAENIDIRGGKLDITTSYDNASTSYYTGGSSYVSGKNTLSETGGASSTKTEYVSVDTGSHKALKGGTKAKTCYYGYTIANDNSSSLTEKTTQNASGGIKISGGTINLSTINAGIKANTEGGQVSGYTATGSGVYIIGSPDDAVNSNNDLEITGGNITIDSGDDGISASGTVSITGDDTVINIKRAYEGIEGKIIIIGTHNASDGPEITTFTADDGLNTSGKTLTYYYESADNEDYNYKKVSASSSSGNNVYIYSGKLTVKIDGSEQSVSLAGKNISYTPAGDGLDANGAHYIYGGTTRVFTPSTGSNSPVDAEEDWILYRAATILAAGTDGMNESVPSKGDAVYITLGGGGNGGPGGGNMFSSNSIDLSSESQNDGAPGGGGQASITAGTLTIKNGDTVIYTDELPYAASFLL